MSESARDSEPRSGGKIARDRRHPAFSRTPYDRPNVSASGSPNWLSRATRKLATCARRVVSSVLWSDSHGDDDDSGSDDQFQLESDAYSKEDNNSLRNEGGFERDYLLMEWDSQTKRAIVMLLLQELFSKEDSDRLINIIESRTVDNPQTDDVADERLNTAPDVHMDDVCCAPVLEARKWINERKMRAASKSLSQSSSLTSCSYSNSSSLHPVEIARSYMRSCTPSSVKGNTPSKSPLPIRMQPLSEMSPYCSSGSSVSSKVRRDHLTTGSCKLFHEICSVRSKVAEGLFRTPSANGDSLAFSFNDSIHPLSTAIGNTEDDWRETQLQMKSINSSKLADEYLDLAKRLPFSEYETSSDGFQLEGAPLIHTTALTTSEDQKDIVAAVSCYDAMGDTQPNAVQTPHASYDQEGDTAAIHPRSNLSVELDSQEEPRSCVETAPETVSSSHEKVINSPVGSSREEGPCQFHSESSVEIPVNDFLNDHIMSAANSK